MVNTCAKNMYNTLWYMQVLNITSFVFQWTRMKFVYFIILHNMFVYIQIHDRSQPTITCNTDTANKSTKIAYMVLTTRNTLSVSIIIGSYAM